MANVTAFHNSLKPGDSFFSRFPHLDANEVKSRELSDSFNQRLEKLIDIDVSHDLLRLIHGISSPEGKGITGNLTDSLEVLIKVLKEVKAGHPSYDTTKIKESIKRLEKLKKIEDDLSGISSDPSTGPKELETVCKDIVKEVKKGSTVTIPIKIITRTPTSIEKYEAMICEVEHDKHGKYHFTLFNPNNVEKFHYGEAVKTKLKFQQLLKFQNVSKETIEDLHFYETLLEQPFDADWNDENGVVSPSLISSQQDLYSYLMDSLKAEEYRSPSSSELKTPAKLNSSIWKVLTVYLSAELPKNEYKFLNFQLRLHTLAVYYRNVFSDELQQDMFNRLSLKQSAESFMTYAKSLHKDKIIQDADVDEAINVCYKVFQKLNEFEQESQQRFDSSSDLTMNLNLSPQLVGTSSNNSLTNYDFKDLNISTNVSKKGEELSPTGNFSINTNVQVPSFGKITASNLNTTLDDWLDYAKTIETEDDAIKSRTRHFIKECMQHLLKPGKTQHTYLKNIKNDDIRSAIQKIEELSVIHNSMAKTHRPEDLIINYALTMAMEQLVRCLPNKETHMKDFWIFTEIKRAADFLSFTVINPDDEKLLEHIIKYFEKMQEGKRKQPIFTFLLDLEDALVSKQQINEFSLQSSEFDYWKVFSSSSDFWKKMNNDGYPQGSLKEVELMGTLFTENITFIPEPILSLRRQVWRNILSTRTGKDISQQNQDNFKEKPYKMNLLPYQPASSYKSEYVPFEFESARGSSKQGCGLGKIKKNKNGVFSLNPLEEEGKQTKEAEDHKFLLSVLTSERHTQHDQYFNQSRTGSSNLKPKEYKELSSLFSHRNIQLSQLLNYALQHGEKFEEGYFHEAFLRLMFQYGILNEQAAQGNQVVSKIHKSLEQVIQYIKQLPEEDRIHPELFIYQVYDLLNARRDTLEKLDPSSSKVWNKFPNTMEKRHSLLKKIKDKQARQNIYRSIASGYALRKNLSKKEMQDFLVSQAMSPESKQNHVIEGLVRSTWNAHYDAIVDEMQKESFFVKVLSEVADLHQINSKNLTWKKNGHLYRALDNDVAYEFDLSTCTFTVNDATSSLIPKNILSSDMIIDFFGKDMIQDCTKELLPEATIYSIDAVTRIRVVGNSTFIDKKIDEKWCTYVPWTDRSELEYTIGSYFSKISESVDSSVVKKNCQLFVPINPDTSSPAGIECPLVNKEDGVKQGVLCFKPAFQGSSFFDPELRLSFEKNEEVQFEDVSKSADPTVGWLSQFSRQNSYEIWKDQNDLKYVFFDAYGFSFKAERDHQNNLKWVYQNDNKWFVSPKQSLKGVNHIKNKIILEDNRGNKKVMMPGGSLNLLPISKEQTLISIEPGKCFYVFDYNSESYTLSSDTTEGNLFLANIEQYRGNSKSALKYLILGENNIEPLSKTAQDILRRICMVPTNLEVHNIGLRMRVLHMLIKNGCAFPRNLHTTFYKTKFKEESEPQEALKILKVYSSYYEEYLKKYKHLDGYRLSKDEELLVLDFIKTSFDSVCKAASVMDKNLLPPVLQNILFNKLFKSPSPIVDSRYEKLTGKPFSTKVISSPAIKSRMKKLKQKKISKTWKQRFLEGLGTLLKLAMNALGSLLTYRSNVKPHNAFSGYHSRKMPKTLDISALNSGRFTNQYISNHFFNLYEIAINTSHPHHKKLKHLIVSMSAVKYTDDPDNFRTSYLKVLYTAVKAPKHFQSVINKFIPNSNFSTFYLKNMRLFDDIIRRMKGAGVADPQSQKIENENDQADVDVDSTYLAKKLASEIASSKKLTIFEAPEYEDIVDSNLDLTEAFNVLQKDKKSFEKLLSKKKQEIESLANKPPENSKKRKVYESELQSGARTPHNLDYLILRVSQRNARFFEKDTFLNDSETNELVSNVVDYMHEKTRQQHRERLLELIQKIQKCQDPIEKKLLEKEFEAHKLAKRAYSPEEHIELLCFEYFSERCGGSKMIRPEQVEKIEGLTNREKLFEVYHSIMGSGKSTLIQILHLMIAAEGDNLMLSIIPSSLLQSNKRMANDISMKTFGQKVIALDFDRNFDNTDELGTGEKLITLRRLKDIENQLLNAMVNRDYVIVCKEHLEALELKYIEMLDQYTNSDDSTVTKEEIQTLESILLLIRKHGDPIFDEMDSEFNSFKELIYTLQSADVMDPKDVRMNVNIFKIIAKDKEIRKYVDLKKKSHPNVTEATMEIIQKRIAEQLSQLDELKIAKNDRKKFVQYVLGELDTIPDFIKKHPSRSAISYAKNQLTGILFSTLSKNGDENYGKSRKEVDKDRGEAAYRLAVPYVASNTPNEKSRFGNHSECASLACQMFAYEGVNIDIVKAVVSSYKSKVREEIELDPSLKLKETKAYKSFKKEFPGFQLFSIRKEKHFEELVDFVNKEENLELLFTIVEEFVLRTDLKVYNRKIAANSQNLFKMFDRLKGHTGTTWNAKTLPDELDVEVNKKVDEKTKNLLLKKAKDKVHVMDIPDKAEDFILDLLTKFLGDSSSQNSDFRGFIDTGAVLRGIDNETVAHSILKYCRNHYPEIKGVAFYDKKGELMCLEEGLKRPILLSQSSLDPSNRFTYWDQAHTTGSDVKQKPTAKAIQTIGAKTMRRDLDQGAWRLRGLDKGQSVEILVPSYNVHLFSKKEINIDEVLDFCESNQKEQLKKHIFRSSIHKMKNIVRSRCLRALQDLNDFHKKTVLYSAIVGELTDDLETDSWNLFSECQDTITGKEFLEKYRDITIDRISENKGLDKKTIKSIVQALKDYKVPKQKDLPDEVSSTVDHTMGSEVETETETETEQETEQEQELVNPWGYKRENQWSEYLRDSIYSSSMFITTPRFIHRVMNFLYRTVRLEYKLMFCAKPNMVGIRDVLNAFSSTSKYKSLFSSNFIMTSNFMPNNMYEGVRPFDEKQKVAREVLVKKTWWKFWNPIEVIVGDADDVTYFRRAIQDCKKEYQRLGKGAQFIQKLTNIFWERNRLCLYDTKLGVTENGHFGISEAELKKSKQFQRNLVELKLWNGELKYSKNEEKVLKEIITPKNKKLWRNLFVGQIIADDEHKLAHLKTTVIGKILTS